MTWNVYIVCGDNVADTNSVNGQQYTDQYIVQSLTATWFDAENHCENVIGTSLATIITDNDMEKAIINIISSGHDYQSTNLSFWIGLYRFKNNIWHWIERMDCNYTLTQNCKDDSHWQMNQPDELPESKYMGHYGAVLFIPDISNPYNNTYLYDMPFEDTNAMVLCNGPVSNYTIPTCSETFCWKQEKHLSDFTMILDVFGISHPYVAYWNSTLFLFGERQIHYTKFQMYSNDFHWKHSVWTTDPNGIQIGENANYAQVGSSFYILIYVSNRVTYAYDRGLVHVNLDTLDVKQITTITMDGAFPRTAYICMVADSKYVYLVRQGNIMHYQIASGQWTAADFDYDVPGFSETVYLNCIVTNDGKSIYIFSRTHSQDGAVAFWVIKYDTSLKQINYFNTTSLCMIEPVYATGIAGRNGKLYVPGCHPSAYKTLVFDPSIEEFENETIDIFSPLIDYMPDYRKSQLVIFDDNILLNVYQGYDVIIHFGVTNTISINFGETNVNTKIWPSHG
eukprot:408036_1